MSPTQPNLAIPYPGLRPFDEADHLLFFGRNEQANELLIRLEDSAFVAVVGSSGSGKSSLVRAGLLPLLRDGFLFGTDNWKIAVARPEHEPYQRLARKLTAFRDDIPQDKVLTLLRSSDDGLVQAVDAVCDDSEAHVLVVIDQFEELFRFRRVGCAQRQFQNCASRDEAAAFVAMLLAAARKDGDRLRVMLTMRSDFVGDCEVFLGLPQAVSQSQFLVPRLTRSQMEEAITGPSRIRHPGFEPFDFEPGLITTLTNDAGDRPDQLPLLQHALMRTWKLSDRKHLTAADYTVAGRIEKAMSNDADEAWAQLDSKDQQLARQMFLLLCDVSREEQMTRRRPMAQEVMAVAAVGCADIERVVRVFQDKDRNFLLPPSSEPISPTSVLDISHESLLRQWRQVQSWLEREADAARQYRRLVDAVQAGESRLTGNALDQALDWRRTRRTPTWAMRYDNARAPEESLLPKCLELIEESKKLRDSEEAEAEFGRKLRIARNVIAICLLSSIIFFLMKDPLREQLGIQREEFDLPENIIEAFYKEDILVLPIRHFRSVETKEGTSEVSEDYKYYVRAILQAKNFDKDVFPVDHVEVALHNRVKVTTIAKLKQSVAYKNFNRPKDTSDVLEKKSADQEIYVLPNKVFVASTEEHQPRFIQVAFLFFDPKTILEPPERVERFGITFLLVIHLLLYPALIFVFKNFYRRFAFRDNEVLESFQVGSRRSQVVFSVVLLLLGLCLLGAGLVCFVLGVREELPMLMLGVPIGVILILLVPTDMLLKRSWAPRFKEAQGILLQLCGFYAVAGSVCLLILSSRYKYIWAPEFLLVRNPWALFVAGIGLVILGKRKYVQATPQTLVREPDRAPVLVNSQTRLYSDRAIGLAAFSLFGFGLPAGVMMFSNLWCIGRRRVAGIGLVAPIVGIVGTVGFAILISYNFGGLKLEMGALVVMVLLGSSFATSWLWRRLSGREIRNHVSFGGALQPRRKALLVLFIASFLAWSLPFYSFYQDTRLRAERRFEYTQAYAARGKGDAGRKLARQGDVEGAIADFKAARKLDPNIRLNPRTNTIDQDPGAVAQLLYGQHLARQGDVERAIIAFKAAQKFDPDIDLDAETDTIDQDPKAVAQTYAARGKVDAGRKLARQGDVEGAIADFKAAQKFDPDIDLDAETDTIDQDPKAVAQKYAARGKAEQKIEQGRRLTEKGEFKEALQAYTEAQTLDPSLTDAEFWNEIGWDFSLNGHPKEGLDASEKSVQLTGNDDPNLAMYRDTRGLARALTGDKQGAIEDFEAYIRSNLPEEKRTQRQQWVNALRKEQDPFTPELLKELLNPSSPKFWWERIFLP